MLISAPHAVRYKRRPAVLYVLRNNGYCWARLVTGKTAEYDVFTRRDLYDEPDDYAAEVFMAAARRGNIEQPAGSMRLASHTEGL